MSKEGLVNIGISLLIIFGSIVAAWITFEHRLVQLEESDKYKTIVLCEIKEEVDRYDIIASSLVRLLQKMEEVDSKLVRLERIPEDVAGLKESVSWLTDKKRPRTQ